ncbi:hypothetical protein [[Mycobacterium] crassicus]|uniref:DUF3761 domain-containing protein n=1 Tax=[Mycobacterium] crassicus TaxID=2872309 RepID=A0ABU5XG13_9MYCO|nr:hypothetical protein [Mycolicibacter sp. MYC098]MEB3021106.1 hypothetical protein [Mycolicibacter sp. MYC098]
MISIVVTGSALVHLTGAPANATPGYGADCIMPSIKECRLLPDADGPHDVQRYCPGQGWINVFAVCRNRFGPYS